MCPGHAGLQRDSGIFQGADHPVDLKRLAGAALWTSANCCWAVPDVTPNTASDTDETPVIISFLPKLNLFCIISKPVSLLADPPAGLWGIWHTAEVCSHWWHWWFDRWVLCYISGLCCQQTGHSQCQRKLTEGIERQFALKIYLKNHVWKYFWVSFDQ